MPARLPLGSQRLVVVTGKGGVGKTTVTAALARAAAGAGRRVLAVEIGHGRLAALLGAERVGHEPRRVDRNLAAARIEPERALADFVHGMLRVRVLSSRLLASTSFQVLAAAAPGLEEFLVLHRLLGWIRARHLGRTVHQLVIVDAPASGHSLPLLEAPRTLGALARLGRVAALLAEMQELLADADTTLVCPVTTPEELAVRETVELHRELRDRLGLPVAPPIVNALPPRRFSAADAAALGRLDGQHAHVRAARFHIERRQQAEAQLAVLRRDLGVRPVRLPFLFAGPESPRGIRALAERLAGAGGLAA